MSSITGLRVSGHTIRKYSIAKGGNHLLLASKRSIRMRQYVKPSNAMQINAGLPELTVPNLIAEIERNNIRYPKTEFRAGYFGNRWTHHRCATTSIC